MKFLYRPVAKNFYSRHDEPIKYLVIHDTGNTNAGANALNHRNYVGTNKRGASAHYFVDDKNVVQFVGDSKAAGAVGDGKVKYGITNSNSLSIEMCINRDGDYNKMYKNTVELTKNLMVKFKIPLNRVVRHYDASRKNCPGHMSKNNWSKWWQFKEDIKQPIEWEIDLSKDSEFGVENTVEQKNSNNVKIKFLDKDINVTGKNIEGSNYVAVRELFEKIGYSVDWQNDTVVISKKKDNIENKHFKENGLDFIQTNAENIEIKKVYNKSLSNSGLNGINGTFYSIGKSHIFGIAMQNNIPLDTNSFVSTFNGVKRGTIWYDGKRMYIARIANAKHEIKTYIKWAISGIMLFPTYEPKREGFVGIYADVLRKCNHSAIGFKGKQIYLIVGENLTLDEFRKKILNSKIAFDGLIALDGGASSQMVYNGREILKSSRPLNHGIFVDNLLSES